MSSTVVLHEIKANGIHLLTINRPEALNALNSDVLSSLEEKLDQMLRMPASELKCVVLTGAGEKAFVAGADIKQISALTSEQAVEFAQRGQKVFTKIEELQVPVIAAVNGFALGGGLELALACDFIYASENARFALPEVTLGLIPGFGGTVRLSKVVGLNKAREMTLTGDMIKADEALAVGLVNKVVPLAELMPSVVKVVESIASRGPLAVAAAKKTILSTANMNVYDGQAAEAQNFGSLFHSSDVREGTLAFIEKRKAQFQGK